MKIIKLNAIDSTNTYLKNLSKNVRLEDELIVLTENQTDGRGQMNSKWQSVVGQSLTFSILKRFDELSITDQSQITYATTLGIKHALEYLNVPAVSIKWPNDIMSYQKKLCGVLIENQILGQKISTSIIGIGLNVNQTEFENLPQATSMKLISGNTFNLDEVFKVLLDEILRSLRNISKLNYEQFKGDYEQSLFRRDKVSVFEDSRKTKFSGIIRGVTKTGELILELEDERFQNYALKQLKMLF